MQDILERHLNAYANNDWTSYREGLTENASYEEIATGRRAVGADQFIEAVRSWKNAFPDLSAKVLNMITNGDQAVLELEWTGTHKSPLELPFGTIQPTNDRVSVRSVFIAEVVGGKIAQARHYFDIVSMSDALRRAALGQPLMPTAQETAQAPVRH